MKLFGYEKDSDKLIELQEATFLSDIEELDKLIEFLKDVKEKHCKVVEKTELCHSHYRDWDVEWKDCSPDIIIATSFEGK